MSESKSDFELLRCFCKEGAQNAFATLVRRHLNLVYGTAFRKVTDSAAAEEITQNVFASLAQKSWQFAPDDSLPAWLHKAALLESRVWLRGEMRRRRREETAAQLGTTMKHSEEPAFAALVPALDEALLSLREKDRAALLLRFYESHSLREVGETLGISEDAAQKRVSGALQQIARFFQKRGFKTVTSAVAATALQQSATSASAATTALIVNAALKCSPPVAGSLFFARLMSLTKIQTAVVCAALVALPVGWQWQQNRSAKIQLAQIESKLAEATSAGEELQNNVERLRRTAEKYKSAQADADEKEIQNQEIVAKVQDFKTRVRGMLTDANYQWPEDLPFVRIPKSIIPEIRIPMLIASAPEGKIRPSARELLALSPDEKKSVESALKKHFERWDNLMNQQIFETNRLSKANIPEFADASIVYVVPPLAEDAKRSVAELVKTLEETLGDERWAIIKPQIETHDTDGPRNMLGLNAENEGREWLVFIREKPVPSWGIRVHQTRQHWDLCSAPFSPTGNFDEFAEMRLKIAQVPPALNTRILAWLQAHVKQKEAQ